jgi:hypothetical protein
MPRKRKRSRRADAPMPKKRRRGAAAAPRKRATSRRRAAGGDMLLLGPTRWRRSNPFSKGMLIQVARTGLAGGLGIVTARIGKVLYQRFLAARVMGTGTAPKWRMMLSDALQVGTMAALVGAVDYGAGRVRFLSPSDRMAYRIGGYGEAGRNALGMAVKMLAPSVDRSRIGLDGPLFDDSQNAMMGDEFYDVPMLPEHGMAGEVVDADTFAGEVLDADVFAGEVVDADTFAGMEDDEDLT